MSVLRVRRTTYMIVLNDGYFIAFAFPEYHLHLIIIFIYYFCSYLIDIRVIDTKIITNNIFLTNTTKNHVPTDVISQRCKSRSNPILILIQYLNVSNCIEIAL